MIDWHGVQPELTVLAKNFEVIARKTHENGVPLGELAAALTLLGIDLQTRNMGDAATVAWLREIADELEDAAANAEKAPH